MSSSTTRPEARAVGDRPPAFALDGVGKRFGDRWAVRGVTLAVDPGSILGLVGPSGSGKTTLARLLTGSYVTDEGQLEIGGIDVDDMSTVDRAGLGYLPQQPALLDDLSATQNLRFHASLQGISLSDRRRSELFELVELVEHDAKRASDLSGGMRRRLALAAALVHRPRLLILDEPTAGIDPILRRRFWDHFRHLRDDGVTLLVATQYVGEAEGCDLVGLLSEGRLIANGSPSDLRRSAAGGDVLSISTRQPLRPTLLEQLEAARGVTQVEVRSAREVGVVVEDGSVASVELLRLLDDGDADVVAVEEDVMSFDDVFVTLVERDATPVGSAEQAAP